MGLIMAVVILSIGDTVKFPSRYDQTDRTMTVIDRWYKRWPYRDPKHPGGRYIRYLFSDLDRCLVDEMRINVQAHYDNIIGVGGKEGKGKSAFCYHICKMYDPEFTLKRGYIYDAYEFVQAINSKEDRGSVFWMDEATNVASNRDWNKEENKLFIQILEMARARGWLLVMAIPLLRRLDVYLRDFRLRYQVEIEELGWELDPHVHRGYWHLTKSSDANYGSSKPIGWGTFPKMPPDVEKEYNENYKNKAMADKFAEIQRKFDENRYGKKNELKAIGEVNRQLIVALRDRGVDYSELQQITGQSYSSLANSYSRGKKEQGMKKNAEGKECD